MNNTLLTLIARNSPANVGVSSGVAPINPATLSPVIYFIDSAANLRDAGAAPADIDEAVVTWNDVATGAHHATLVGGTITRKIDGVQSTANGCMSTGTFWSVPSSNATIYVVGYRVAGSAFPIWNDSTNGISHIELTTANNLRINRNSDVATNIACAIPTGAFILRIDFHTTTTITTRATGVALLNSTITTLTTQQPDSIMGNSNNTTYHNAANRTNAIALFNTELSAGNKAGVESYFSATYPGAAF